MTLNELRAQRTKLLVDAQAILVAQPDSEKRASAQRMIADADQLEIAISNQERIDKLNSEERSLTAPPRAVPNGGQQVENRSAKEKEALDQYIRFGRTTEENRSLLKSANTSNIPQELRALNSGATSGGYVIPQAYYPTLIEAQKAWGELTTIVNSIKTEHGEPMKIALDNDTANSLSVLGEGSAASDADPSLDGKILSTDWLTTGVVKISMPLLADASFDVENWLKNVFGKRYYRGLAALITAGSSTESVTNNIASIVSGAHAAVTSASATAIAYNEITALYAALDPAYIPTSSFVMNSTTRGLLLGVVDEMGRPLYVPSPNANAFDMLLGRPVVMNQAQDNVAASKAALMFGDFKEGYLLREVGDMSILRLNERYADSGQVGFIGFARAGGVNTDAGLHPIVKLVQKSS
jgi:HK97 family phage major capsid protein